MSQRPPRTRTATPLAACSRSADPVTARFSVAAQRDPSVSLPARQQLDVRGDACALSGRFTRRAIWKHSRSLLPLTLLVALVVGCTASGLMLWMNPGTAWASNDIATNGR